MLQAKHGLYLHEARLILYFSLPDLVINPKIWYVARYVHQATSHETISPIGTKGPKTFATVNQSVTIKEIKKITSHHIVRIILLQDKSAK